MIFNFLRLFLEQFQVHSTIERKVPGFDPWVRQIPGRREWQPTPALLPGKSHGWKSLAGYSPQGCKESGTTESATSFTHSQRHIFIIKVSDYLLCPHTLCLPPYSFSLPYFQPLESESVSSSIVPDSLQIMDCSQAPLSIGFFRPGYWRGLPFPSPGDLPDPGIKPRSPVVLALAGRFFTI